MIDKVSLSKGSLQKRKTSKYYKKGNRSILRSASQGCPKILEYDGFNPICRKRKIRALGDKVRLKEESKNAENSLGRCYEKTYILHRFLMR